jgi:hypothetical protein
VMVPIEPKGIAPTTGDALQADAVQTNGTP